MAIKKNNPSYTVGKIKSLEDLKLEKARLELEILRTEDQIKGNYRHILEALTLRNIFHAISNDISAYSNAISKVYELGKNIFGRKKKKKKDMQNKHNAPNQEIPAVPESSDKITGEETIQKPL